MHSPIQLLDYKILRINFDTRSTEDQPSEIEFSHAMEIFRAEEQGNTWLVRLDVQFKPAAEKSSPYLGEIAVVGTFTLGADFPADKAEAMVHMNGGSILYGMAREILSNITARAVHGPVLMPTLDARSFIPHENPEAVSSSF
jgi:preprotein translocase subunit SecB